MTIAAAGYILRVPPARRELLLAEVADSGSSFYSSKPNIAEPVTNFDHSRSAPLVVFASFEARKITHIADGKRGVSAGTGLARLNLHDVQPLTRPVTFRELESGAPARVRRHLKRVLKNGGLLPPKTLGALVDRIVELDPSIAGKLARFSERRRNAIRNLRPLAAENLALQKESLGIALEICGIPRDALLDWQAPATMQQSFLDGLPGAKVREDVMLLKDFSIIPGFDLGGEVTRYGSKMFQDPKNPSIRLTVTMANRLPLEQQTGADLIYFNEAYRSFVMIQYKAMEKGTEHAEFRWKNGDQFEKEIARMDALLLELRKIVSGSDPDGFRFSDNPFFLKFCPRVVFNPDDKGLFKGIYLPLDLWKRAFAAGKLKGKKKGNVLTFENVGRRINNDDFVRLVAGAWVGTSIEQSAILGPLIREVLATGRTITFAVKHVVPQHNGLNPPEQNGIEESDGDNGRP